MVSILTLLFSPVSEVLRHQTAPDNSEIPKIPHFAATHHEIAHVVTYNYYDIMVVRRVGYVSLIERILYIETSYTQRAQAP